MIDRMPAEYAYVSVVALLHVIDNGDPVFKYRYKHDAPYTTGRLHHAMRHMHDNSTVLLFSSFAIDT